MAPLSWFAGLSDPAAAEFEARKHWSDAAIAELAGDERAGLGRRLDDDPNFRAISDQAQPHLAPVLREAMKIYLRHQRRYLFLG